MSPGVSPARRLAFYRAAHRGLLALEARERASRRFGVEADARWSSFCGHLGVAERLDILLRDAAVQWTAGFSPALVFQLPGLAADEPFGPDWAPLAEVEARRVWAEADQPATLAAVAEILALSTTVLSTTALSLPPLAATTRLVVAGGAAVAALAAQFAARQELSWADQVVVVAASPAVRQFAGLVAPLLPATAPTRLVAPVGEPQGSVVRAVLRKLGLAAGGQVVVSSDASPQEGAWAHAVGGGGA